MKDFKESNLYKNTSDRLPSKPINLDELNELDAAMAELDECRFNREEMQKNETINEFYSRILNKPPSNSAIDISRYIIYGMSPKYTC